MELQSLSPGIDKKTSFNARLLAQHPEAIEEAVKMAKEHGEIPTRRWVHEVLCQNRDRERAAVEAAKTDLNCLYRELLREALIGAEKLRYKLSRVVRSRPENSVQDGPIPTDAVGREMEEALKAKLERIAELNTKIPGGRMVSVDIDMPSNASIEGQESDKAEEAVDAEYIGREIISRPETYKEIEARIIAEMPEEDKIACVSLGVEMAKR